MADVVADRVIVELEARLGQYEQNVARAEQKFDRAMGNIQKSAGRTEAFVSRASRLMGAALAGISAVAVARTFLAIADEAKKMDSTLKLATSTFGSFGQAQQDVRRISDETRSGLSETASLYANFVRGAKELGATQAEAARATETFSKTLKISGADTNQAASATLQFGQALAAGALRGDELNSILEASPRLARLLAEAMGKPIGQIKQLGEEGKLTSDKLLKALTDRKFTAGIDAEFREVPVTFEDAMKRVENAAIITFGAFDRGGEFSTALANFIGDGSDGFAELERKAEDFGISVRGTLEGLADAFDPLFDTASAVFDALGIKFSDIFTDGREQVRDILLAIDQASGWLANQGALGATLTGNLGNYLNDRPRAGTNLLDRFNARVEASDMERRFNRQIRILESAQNNGDSGGGSKPPASTGKPKKAKKSPLDPDAFAREEAALNDQILRLKGDQVVDAEIRAALERDRIEKARVATVKEVEGEKRYTEAQKAIVVALVDQAAALEQAKVIRERDIQLAKESLDARIAALTNEQDLQRAQADLVGTREERHAIERRLLNLAYEMERAELDAVLASQDASKTQKAIAQARKDAFAGIQAADQRGVDQRFESPLERYRRRTTDTSTSDQVEELIGQELDYLRDGMRDAITKRLGVKDPFLAGLIDLFLEKNFIGPLVDAFNKGGGLKGLFTTVSGFFGGGSGATVGMAQGGSMMLGGRGGTDRNTLSLNGRPIANVSRGEVLAVGSKTLRGGRGGVTVVSAPRFDLSNAVVTPELYAEMERISNESATRAAGASYAAGQQSMPGTLNKFGQLKN